MAHESLRVASAAIASVAASELDPLDAADATLQAFADDMLTTAREYAAAKRPFAVAIAPPSVAERLAFERADDGLDAMLAVTRAHVLAALAEWRTFAGGADAPLLSALLAAIAGRGCPVDDVRAELDYLLHLIGSAEHALDHAAITARAVKLVAGVR